MTSQNQPYLHKISLPYPRKTSYDRVFRMVTDLFPNLIRIGFFGNPLPD